MNAAPLFGDRSLSQHLDASLENRGTGWGWQSELSRIDWFLLSTTREGKLHLSHQAYRRRALNCPLHAGVRLSATGPLPDNVALRMVNCGRNFQSIHRSRKARHCYLLPATSDSHADHLISRMGHLVTC